MGQVSLLHSVYRDFPVRLGSVADFSPKFDTGTYRRREREMWSKCNQVSQNIRSLEPNCLYRKTALSFGYLHAKNIFNSDFMVDKSVIKLADLNPLPFQT